MQAEQNELITRIGPGTACGALLRSYWQPVALLDEFDPRLDAAHWRTRPVKPVRLLGQDLVLFRDGAGRFGLLDRALPAPRRRPGVRPLRRRRPALPVPRLEVRRRRRLPRDAGRADRLAAVPARAPAQLSAARAPACCSPGSAPRDRRRRALPAFDCLPRAGQPQLRVQGPVALQLAAGVRGRHRPGASVVPAPLPARRVDGRRRGLRPPVPRRERRRRRRRALADDARSCASSTAPRSASTPSPTDCCA